MDNSNYPSEEIYFEWSFVPCKLRIYTKDKEFITQMLLANKAKFLNADDFNDWEEVDTRLIVYLICNALPRLVQEISPTPVEIAKALNIRR